MWQGNFTIDASQKQGKEEYTIKHRFSSRLSRALFHRKLRDRKFLFFYTETPGGTCYLSILKFGPKGLSERRVFIVTGELCSTPYVDGMNTRQLFLNAKTSPSQSKRRTSGM